MVVFAGERDELERFEEVVDEWSRRLLEDVQSAQLPSDYFDRWRETAGRLSEAIDQAVPPSLDADLLAGIRGELLSILRTVSSYDRERPLDSLEGALLHLEAIRQVVRDMLDAHVADQHDARALVTALQRALPRMNRRDLGRLLGVSERSVQRVLASADPVEPTRRLLMISRLVALLSHGWTPEGVVAWFSRPRRELEGQRVLDVIDDPVHEQEIVSLARYGRAQHGS